MAECKLKVFLCHASQDKPVIRDLYQKLLKESWIEPWLDEEKLLPGMDWDFEIEKAVESANAIIVCISNNSVTKEGYIQRELRFVLDIALEKPEGEIFVVPVRLDNCQVPRRLRSWHYVDYFVNASNAYMKILQSLDVRSKSLHSRGENYTQELERNIVEEPNLKELESKAIQFELTGKWHDALLIYYQIKKADLHFPRVDKKIEELEKELSNQSRTDPLKSMWKLHTDEPSFHYNDSDVRIGIWAPSNAGKTVYLLSLYISAMQEESKWLIGFDENTNQFRREYLLDSVDALSQGVFPASTKIGNAPDLYGLVFYPSPENSKIKLKSTGSDKLVSFWKMFSRERLLDKTKKGLQISLNDVGGEAYLNEPADSPLWEHLAGCQGILCLLDPSDIENNFRVFSNLVDFLHLKVAKDKPDAIVNGRYLPHYVSVCFTKMDRVEWRPMINSPEDVIRKINNLTDLDIRRRLWVHFMPERINFHCVSSIGFDFAETKRIKPINIFNPLNDWIEK